MFMFINNSFTWTDILAYSTVLVTLFLLHSSILSTLTSLEYAFENISRQAPIPLDVSFSHDILNENPADLGSSVVNGYSSLTPWFAAVSSSRLRHVSDLGRVSSQLAAISLLMIITSMQALLAFHHFIWPTIKLGGWIAGACSASHQRMQTFKRVCFVFSAGLHHHVSQFPRSFLTRMKAIASIRRRVEPEGETLTPGSLDDDMVAGENQGCPLHTNRVPVRCAVHDIPGKDTPASVPRQPEAQSAHPLKSNLSVHAPAFAPSCTSTSTSSTPDNAQSAVTIKPRGRLHRILASSLLVLRKAKVDAAVSPPAKASSQDSITQQSEPSSAVTISSAPPPTARLNRDAPVFTPGRSSPLLALSMASTHDVVPGSTGKEISTLSSSLFTSQRLAATTVSEFPATPVSAQSHCGAIIADGAVSPFVPMMNSTPKMLYPPSLSPSFPNEVESPMIYSTQPHWTQMTAGPVAPMAAPVPYGLRQSLFPPRPALGPATNRLPVNNRMNLPPLITNHRIPQDAKGRPLLPTSPVLLAEPVHKSSVASRFPVYKGYKSSALFPA